MLGFRYDSYLRGHTPLRPRTAGVLEETDAPISAQMFPPVAPQQMQWRLPLEGTLFLIARTWGFTVNSG